MGERHTGHVMLTCAKGYEENKHGAIINGVNLGPSIPRRR